MFKIVYDEVHLFLTTIFNFFNKIKKLNDFGSRVTHSCGVSLIFVAHKRTKPLSTRAMRESEANIQNQEETSARLRPMLRRLLVRSVHRRSQMGEAASAIGHQQSAAKEAPVSSTYPTGCMTLKGRDVSLAAERKTGT